MSTNDLDAYLRISDTRRMRALRMSSSPRAAEVTEAQATATRNLVKQAFDTAEVTVVELGSVEESSKDVGSHTYVTRYQMGPHGNVLIEDVIVNPRSATA